VDYFRLQVEVSLGLKIATLALLDAHVFEFAPLEDVSAFRALDKFGVLVAAGDLHARVLARVAG
jgi:hypothetical protein